MSENTKEELERARAQLFNLLKTRPRSKYEVKTRLRQKGFSNSTIQEIIDMAELSGLLNDEMFAKLWIEDRRISKPKGRQALEQELREKGIDREIIAHALKNIEDDEYTVAYQLATTRLARYQSETRETQRRKLGAFLRRRGFSFVVINKIVRELV